MKMSLFVSCPKGLEYLLEEEVKALGLNVTRVSPQGVYGEASLAVIYLLCLWSRLANRVQVILFSGQARNEQMIYALCHQFPWQTLFSSDKTFAIQFHGLSTSIRNAMFGAQVVKDAVVDHFRKLDGSRPSIDRENPQIVLHAHLKQDELTVSFDVAGYSLHQRGYRTQAGAAPIKENIAAAMLVRARWPQYAEEGFALHDPFCGSGTIVIEAAMMAAHIAPGLLRDDQSLHHWVQHQPSLWEKLRAQALQEVKPVAHKLHGTDQDPVQITMAIANAARAGVGGLVAFTAQPLAECTPPHEKGLLICNPPYGERLGNVISLVPHYQALGQIVHAHYQGWQAAILTSTPLLAKATGLRSTKQYTLYNGAIECKLYCMTINASNQLKRGSANGLSDHAQMFANRLEKNAKHLQKWAKRNQISCYRVYDADLPEYAYAIDRYNDHVVLQEYAPPASIPEHKAEKRRLDVLQVVPQILGVSPDNLIVKQRKQQKGTNQYHKMNETRHAMVVNEGAALFKVNLHDYLDTGLFLDHRPLRMRFNTLSKGTRFLNCFCYTGTASVHAALAGALTTNVDLSNTYLKWAEDNFRLNHIDMRRHQFIHDDCLAWLERTRDRFDVIFLDPPSFSNSKRMTETLDIQRDQETLIELAMGVLATGGKLYFSTNRRHFKLSPNLLETYSIKDMTEESIDDDFKQNHRIHHCFLIQCRTLVS